MPTLRCLQTKGLRLKQIRPSVTCRTFDPSQFPRSAPRCLHQFRERESFVGPSWGPNHVFTDAAAIERQLRLAIGDAAFDAIPDAPGKAGGQSSPRSSVRRRPRREKLFGHRPIPLDRNAKARIKVWMLALTRRTEPGKAYGQFTAGARPWARPAVRIPQRPFRALLPVIRGHCGESRLHPVIAEAIRMLEQAGVMTWANGIERVREATAERDMFGRPAQRWRVIRTSNTYRFVDPIASKSDFQSGTANQVLTSIPPGAKVPAQHSKNGKLGKTRLGDGGEGRIFLTRAQHSRLPDYTGDAHGLFARHGRRGMRYQSDRLFCEPSRPGRYRPSATHRVRG
jgi:hypothetical protein